MSTILRAAGLRSVAGLLDWGRPSAVAGFVVSVIVNAVNGRVRRSLAHVVSEVFVGEPSFADRDPAPTIAGEVVDARISAAFSHRLPGSERPCYRADSGRSVTRELLGSALRCCLSLQTTTTRGIAVGQAASGRECFGAAGTQAAPHHAVPSAPASRFDSRQATECHTSQIAGARVEPNWGYSVVSQVVSSFKGDGAVRGCGSLATILSSAPFYQSAEAFA